MTIIGSLRDAVTAAGGTPTSYNKVALLRQLVTALGGTPTKRDVIGLLRQAVTAAGGTPTKYAEVYVLRELLVALGATAATFILYKLYEQLATAAAGGVGVPEATPGVDSTLDVPSLERTSAVLDTPPVLVGDFSSPTYDPENVETWARLETADDHEFLTHYKAAYARLHAVGNPTFALGGYVPAAAGFARLSALQIGEDWTDYSTLVAWGDDTAPTITTSSTASVAENALLSIALTADEGIATWAISGGVDLASFEINGTTLRWVSNGTKDYEAANDADTNNTYIVDVSATDYAGNAATKTITVTVTDVSEAVPAELATTNGVNKSQYIDVTSTPKLTATMNNAIGARCCVRTTTVGATKSHFEVTINGIGGGGTGGIIEIGVCDSALALGAAVFNPNPGGGSVAGFAMTFDTTVDTVIRHSGGTTGGTTPAPVANDIIIVEFDKTSKAVTYQHKRGATITSLASFTMTSNFPTNWTAYVGGNTNAGPVDGVTTNFSGPFAVTPTATYSAYG